LALPTSFQNIQLSELSEDEWEALCTHCGFCCLHRIQDVETGDIYTTRVLCEFYDLNAGRCSVYCDRFRLNPGCTKITQGNIADLSWLPYSCNYRRAYEKRPLLENRLFPEGKEAKSRKKCFEKVLGCKVVLYREGMDLAEYLIFQQCG